MSATTHAAMHRDHRVWNSDIDFWHDDLKAWQTELAKVQNELREIEVSLCEHTDALKLHESAIRTLAKDIGGHEHSLVLLESGGESGTVQQLGQRHDVETSRHSRQRVAHERLKRAHHCLMAHCRHLFEALKQGTSPSTA